MNEQVSIEGAIPPREGGHDPGQPPWPPGATHAGGDAATRDRLMQLWIEAEGRG